MWCNTGTWCLFCIEFHVDPSVSSETSAKRTTARWLVVSCRCTCWLSIRTALVFVFGVHEYDLTENVGLGSCNLLEWCALVKKRNLLNETSLSKHQCLWYNLQPNLSFYHECRIVFFSASTSLVKSSETFFTTVDVKILIFFDKALCLRCATLVRCRAVMYPQHVRILLSFTANKPLFCVQPFGVFRLLAHAVE